MVTKFLNIDTDNTLSADSNERVPSQKAVKSYTDTLITSKQNKVLTTPIEIDSDEETTVEGALDLISSKVEDKQDQSLSSSITVDGTQQTTVEGTLNALNIYANSKQNNLTAGDNITINNNVISAKDTTYIAGIGISIDEDSDENLVISNTQTNAEWGNIAGTLSNQIDLQNALNSKQDKLTTINSGTDIEVVAEQSNVSETVSGTTSVTISANEDDSLTAVTLYGATSQASTPTPSDPVDIVCNNGVLKVRHQSGLPLGYMLVDSIRSTARIALKNYTTQNTELEAKFVRLVADTQYLYASDSSSSSTTNTSAYIVGSGNWRFDGDTGAVSISTDIEYTSIQNKNGVWLNGTLVVPYTNVSDFTSTSILGVFSTQSSAPILLKYLIHRESGIVIAHYIPCIAPDNTVGLYDIVNGEFFTNENATITAGTAVSDPIEIYTDGTVETIEDTIGNTATAANLLKIGDYQDAQSVIDGQITRNVGIKFFDGTETWYSLNSRNDLFMFYPDDAYKPSAPMSLICTHLAGSSQSTAQQSQNTIRLTYAGDSDYGVFCAGANNITSISGFKTWLATQYAAGTPVIVIYPLATPTTESVAGQTLEIQEGTNTIAITQSAINNLSLSATYNIAYIPTKINFKNDTGYTTNKGTVTKVNNTSPDSSGNVTIAIPAGLPTQTGQSGKFLTTDGTSASWAVVQSSGNGKNIGEVYFSESSSAQDNTGGLPLFTGETIANADQVYPDFYDWVLAHTSLQISASGYETALTTYGECPKYVIDDINKTIRLPKLVNYIKMANTTDGISQNAAGLPNITGTVGTQNWQTTTIGPVPSIGALSGNNDSNSANTAGSATGSGTLSIDASLSNPIYGNSNTVTPAHTTLFPWVWAYNVAIPASTAQAAEFQNALTGKADVDLGNLTDTGKIKVAHLAMPGDEYVDLTLGTSGATYTAPADGYVCIRKVSSGSNQVLSIYNNSNGMQQTIVSAGNNKELALIMLCKKGDIFGIWYELGGATQLFRFVYAKGAEN